MAPSAQEEISKNTDDSVSDIPDENAHLDPHPDRQYTKKRWTLGDSSELVEGQPKESPLVAAGWIIIPCAIVFSILAFLFK